MNRKQKSALEALATEFSNLDEERLEIERRSRLLKKRLKALQEGIQEFVGSPEVIDMPLVAKIGAFFITQVKKHRIVPTYEYDFVEFKVIDSTSTSSK